MVATRTRTPFSPTAPVRQVRCAIYTRKSTDENLDSDFNSLDAQREAAEAYISSQRSEGWVALETRYDDPAFSAATTNRPALHRLLADVEAGRIDAVVVCKIDRLSRSLRDFGRLIETFKRHGVAFVSVTQRFDTSSSMGKLTLNILMSFAEFEREVTRERVRDKMAAAKRRGKHPGGLPVLGYDTDRAQKRLVVNETEAALVRRIFERFVSLRSTSKVAEEVNRDGFRKKAWVTAAGKTVGGAPWTKGDLYHLLHNIKYRGLVPHRGETFPGEHEAIISQDLWDKAQAVLAEQHRAKSATRHETPAWLHGLVRCAACDRAMGPTYTIRRGRQYRFYLCSGAGKKGYSTCPVRSIAAGTIEDAVIRQLRIVLRSPEIVARTIREARLREVEDIDRLRAAGDETNARRLEADVVNEAEVIEALQRFDAAWSELFPAEQYRIVQLLVERVDVGEASLELRLRASGLKSLVVELRAEPRAGSP